MVNKMSDKDLSIAFAFFNNMTNLLPDSWWTDPETKRYIRKLGLSMVEEIDNYRKILESIRNIIE